MSTNEETKSHKGEKSPNSISTDSILVVDLDAFVLHRSDCGVLIYIERSKIYEHMDALLEDLFNIHSQENFDDKERRLAGCKECMNADSTASVDSGPVRETG